MPLYLDLSFLLNFFIDCLLLLAADHLMGFPSRGRRILTAGLLGACYGTLCLIPGFHFLTLPHWYLIFLCLISAAAFGMTETALRRGTLFFLLSMALGGMAQALRQARFSVLLLEALGLYLLTRLSFGSSQVGASYVPITVSQGQKSISFTALRDTGNQLRDPVTGEPVIVVAPSQAQQLTGLKLSQIKSPLETMLHPPIPGLRLIPYHCVGAEHRMLLGLRFPAVKVGRRWGQALLAFAPENFGDSPFYQALT